MIAQWSWHTFWLILHILGAIVAFGPTFAFPLLGRYAATHPQHAHAITEATSLVAKRLVTPVAVLVPLFGLALIYTDRLDLWGSEWLVASIAWYIVAFFFSLLVQTPNSAKLVRALASPPAGAPSGTPAGPPPHVAALIKRLQFGGMFLTASVIGVLVLMVWQPGR